MATVMTVLVLLAVLAFTAALGKRVTIPTPLLLIASGIALSFAPGFERVDIDPAVFFLLFIPPLLFADGWLIAKRELYEALTPVLLLAFGLVFMTVVGIGLFLHWLIPALPLAAAFALGAIVSPTDAVATASMVGRVGLPPRATHILKGESLINDASGLVAFRLAVAAVATGTFSWFDAAGNLARLAIGGVLAGLVVAWLIGRIRVGLRNRAVDDPSVQTVLSVLTPFAAYVAAEQFHMSGILAVVAAGLYAGWNDFRSLDASTRQHSWEVWAMLLFVFNGLVFVLLGMSLAHALARLGHTGWRTFAGYALTLWAALTVLRLLWVFPAAYLPRLLSRWIPVRGKLDSAAEVFLVGWAGLRGSVTMAAALSIPATLANGEAFPARDLIVFLAASTIVLTLVINGLTLPLFVRALGVGGDRSADSDLRAAEIAVAQAGILAIGQELAGLERPADIARAEALLEQYRRRLERHTANAERQSALAEVEAAERRLLVVGLESERRELYAMRDSGTINDESLREIEARLDNAELLAGGAQRRTH